MIVYKEGGQGMDGCLILQRAGIHTSLHIRYFPEELVGAAKGLFEVSFNVQSKST